MTKVSSQFSTKKKKIIIIKGEIPPQKDREKDDDRQKASWKSSESFLPTGKKGGKLDKSHLSSANKGHKQLEDDYFDMEKDEDMDEMENSSDAESGESSAENMSGVSDVDDESDVDNVDDDDGPTNVEEPEIGDRGKTFHGKKKGLGPARPVGCRPIPQGKITRSQSRLCPRWMPLICRGKSKRSCFAHVIEMLASW